MVRGRKPRAQKSTINGTSSPSTKSKASNVIHVIVDDDDQSINSPKRKETKIDGVLIENGSIKTKEAVKGKVFRPATRSTRKINEYFARLPANGLIRVQNGHNSHSDDSCDSLEDQTSTENEPPSDVTQCKLQKMTNGPILLPEGHTANKNIFLQEPVLKLDFDKSKAVTNNTCSPIKSSFLTAEINGKFQTLPPAEYINKVLNVNGSHTEDESKDTSVFLLNSDSNSSDSGVVIGADDMMKSPIQMPGQRRRKPTTPHRMILCTSPSKVVDEISSNCNGAQVIKPQRPKKSAKAKLQLPINDNNVINQDHNYDGIQPKTQNGVEKVFKAPTAPVDNNKKVTEFFTVRRSVRKTKKEVQEERKRNVEQAIKEGREDGLAVRFFDQKGRGIVTTRSFQRGEFVVEYIGDFISMQEANERETKYAADDNTGCYMYYFKHNEQQYCIDATAESGKLGRLVNHSRNGNLMTRTIMVDKRPHLVLVAKDDLPAGVEVTYDYGDRSKEALAHHPWLAF